MQCTINVHCIIFLPYSVSYTLHVGTCLATIPATADSVGVWTDSQFKSLFGRSFSTLSDTVVFMNGDAFANDVHVEGSQYYKGTIFANMNKTNNKLMTVRLNYIVVLNK